MERRLGRGLGSLLGQNDADRAQASSDDAKGMRELPLKAIRPNPAQPRKVFDSEHLEELKQSIEAHGLLQPIVVRPLGNGLYEIISGERRWRAARLAGLESIPVMIRTADDKVSLELAIVENVQRQDLDPIEKAKGFHVLAETFGLSHDQIAERVGLQRSTVANLVRLLELPKEIQDGVSAGLIAMGHARALLGVKEAAQQRSAFEQVVRQELSVRDTERLVQHVQAAGSAGAAGATLAADGAASAGKAKDGPEKPREPWQGTLESRMREHLGAKVELLKGKGYRGRIVVHFNGREDLERITELLGPKDLL
ncbi:MAG: ParB/RepB/Spo0J family partition protein [Planctomycetota bacterium]